MNLPYRSDIMHIRARANQAFYSRPESRTERMSNPFGSATANAGLLSQIVGGSHFHKAENQFHSCRYETEQVALLFIPRWMTVTSNEINDFGRGTETIFSEDRRTLRTTSVLVGNPRKLRFAPAFASMQSSAKRFAGVDYIISFRIRASSQADIVKYQKMFVDRCRKGRFWGQPCLGIREFPALIDLVQDFRKLDYPLDLDGNPLPMVEHADGLKTADYSADSGLCFYGTDWDDPQHPNYFAPFRIERGIVRYPSWDEVRRLGIKRENPKKVAKADAKRATLGQGA